MQSLSEYYVVVSDGSTNHDYTLEDPNVILDSTEPCLKLYVRV